MIKNNGIKSPMEEDGAQGMLEGRNAVLEGIKSGRTIDKILVASGQTDFTIARIETEAQKRGIPVQKVDRRKLDSLSTTSSHQGVIAFCAAKEYCTVDDILDYALKAGEKPFIILCDSITDPHNLGAILRTACAVGAHGVVIPKHRSVGLTATVAKSSAGALEYMNVAKVVNIASTVEELKEKGVWILGTDIEGDMTFYEPDLKIPLAIVIGNEGKGLGPLVRGKCDFLVRIPMKGNINSLNASVAGAVVMYEVFRQRGVFA